MVDFSINNNKAKHRNMTNRPSYRVDSYVGNLDPGFLKLDLADEGLV